MFLSRVSVRNFRSIRECSVALGSHTAILGANGAGKSTLLRAIDKFYSPSSQVELDDFFGCNHREPIEIALTFNNLNPEEVDLFASHIDKGELSVVRVFEASGGRNNGRYYGFSLQHPPFLAIRNTTGAREKKAVYDQIRSDQSNY